MAETCGSQDGGLGFQRQHRGDGVACAARRPRLQPLRQSEQHHHRSGFRVVADRDGACAMNLKVRP